MLFKATVRITDASICPFGAPNPITIELDPGECILLYGESGVGKTTLVEALADLRQIPGATVEVLEWDATLPRDAQRVGILFQDARLIDSLNVYENIELSARKACVAGDRAASVARWLKAVGLSDDGERHECKRPGELSGGMRRRAALAQILARGFRVVALDEPFAGLDKKTASDIAKLLRTLSLQEKVSFIIVSHQVEYVEALGSKQIEIQPRRKDTDGEKPDGKGPRPRRFTHWRFAVRTGAKFLHYALPSALLVAIALAAAGASIGTFFSDLLDDTDLAVVTRPVFAGRQGPFWNWVRRIVDDEVKGIVQNYGPSVRRRVFAVGVARGFMIEIGPLLTALLLAGVIGSAYAGEVGVMRATRQTQLLDNLRVWPGWWSLGPSAIAAMCAAPFLTLIGTWSGIGAGLWFVTFVRGRFFFEQVWPEAWRVLWRADSFFSCPWVVNIYRGFGFMAVILFCSHVAPRLYAWWYARRFRSEVPSDTVPLLVTLAVVSSCVCIILADFVFYLIAPPF